MLKYLFNIFILLNTIISVNSFIATPIHMNNNNLIKNNQKLLNYNMVVNNEFCPDYLYKYTKYFNGNQSEFIIKKISSTFPQLDSISHHILHTCDVLINIILNSNLLPMDTKKTLVLRLVEITQNGDATGSHILAMYHDLVNCLL